MKSQFLMLTECRRIGAELEGLAALANMRPREGVDGGGLQERLGVLCGRLKQLSEQAQQALVDANFPKESA